MTEKLVAGVRVHVRRRDNLPEEDAVLNGMVNAAVAMEFFLDAHEDCDCRECYHVAYIASLTEGLQSMISGCLLDYDGRSVPMTRVDDREDMVKAWADLLGACGALMDVYAAIGSPHEDYLGVTVDVPNLRWLCSMGLMLLGHGNLDPNHEGPTW